MACASSSRDGRPYQAFIHIGAREVGGQLPLFSGTSKIQAKLFLDLGRQERKYGN